MYGYPSYVTCELKSELSPCVSVWTHWCRPHLCVYPSKSVCVYQVLCSDPGALANDGGGGDYNPQKLMTMCFPQRIYSSQMPRKLTSKWFSWQSNIISDCKGPTYLCLQLKRGNLKTQEKENLFIKSKEMQCVGSWLSYRKKVKRESERERERETSDMDPLQRPRTVTLWVAIETGTGAYVLTVCI